MTFENRLGLGLGLVEYVFITDEPYLLDDVAHIVDWIVSVTRGRMEQGLGWGSFVEDLLDDTCLMGL